MLKTLLIYHFLIHSSLIFEIFLTVSIGLGIIIGYILKYFKKIGIFTLLCALGYSFSIIIYLTFI